MEFKYDEKTRAALETFITTEDVTHSELAARMHVTPTRVTKYLGLNKPGRVPEPDMPRVEQAAKNFLRHVIRRTQLRQSLFENNVAKLVAKTLGLARKSGDVALIHSVGGVGKTSGVDLYARDNPNTLMITAREYACGAGAVEQMMLNEYLINAECGWPGNIRRALWLEMQLKGSECLIIVDNAQRLRLTAFKWLMDFHDATLCPVALIGNTEVLRMLRQNDTEGQLLTRIGMVVKIKLITDLEFTAGELIKQFAPGAEVITDECVNVLAAAGNARTLKKQLSLASAYFEPSGRDWNKAFRRAGAQLVKPTLIET